MNKIFVIEGTDGSGKQTQTNLIYKRLLKDGKEVFKTSFFNISHFSNCMIREIYRKMYSVNRCFYRYIYNLWSSY